MSPSSGSERYQQQHRWEGISPLTAQPIQSIRKRAKQETRAQRVKKEENAQDRVKREHDGVKDTHEDSYDLTILEAKSCKRPRTDQDVIILYWIYSCQSSRVSFRARKCTPTLHLSVSRTRWQGYCDQIFQLFFEPLDANRQISY